MTTQTSHVSSTYGRYIGRVGALATALGIGVMVVTSPGLASADPSDSSSTSTDASPAGAGSSTESTDTGTASTGATTSEGSSTSTPPSSAKSTSSGSQATSSAGASTTPSGATSSSTQVAPGVTISSSGGAHQHQRVGGIDGTLDQHRIAQGHQRCRGSTKVERIRRLRRDGRLLSSEHVDSDPHT